MSDTPMTTNELRRKREFAEKCERLHLFYGAREAYREVATAAIPLLDDLEARLAEKQRECEELVKALTPYLKEQHSRDEFCSCTGTGKLCETAEMILLLTKLKGGA